MGSGSTKLPWRRNTKESMRTKTNLRSSSFTAADAKKEHGIQRAMTDGVIVTETDSGIEITDKIDKNSNSTVLHKNTNFTLSDLKSDCAIDKNKNGIGSKACTPPLSARKQSDAKLMKYRNYITSSELYNLIVAETWQGHTQIHDAGYMLLIDCREKESYEPLHIVTARHHSALYSEYGLLMPSQLTLFHIVILYSHSATCNNLYEMSKKLADDEVEHYMLKSGAQEFFKQYSFLSTQKHFLQSDLRITLKTMPSVIIPGRLYQGNAKHALDPYIISTLGITHIVNVTLEHPNKFEDSVKYLRIQLDDQPQVDLHVWLPRTSNFIKSAIEDNDSLVTTSESSPKTNPSQRGVVLVHCNLGRSRSSTVVIGYLMQVRKMSLGQASELLKDCRNTVRPNYGFLEQLLIYEKEVFGENVTQLNDLIF